MIGVTTPEYQLSVGNLGELVEDLEVAPLSTGKIAVAYTRTNLSGVVQLFDPATGTATTVQLLSDFGNGGAYVTDVDVVGLPGGGFAVMGMNGYGIGGPNPYYLWTFSATGALTGGPMPVLGTTAAYASLQASPTGFFITYGDGPHGARAGMVQRYDASGSPIGQPAAVPGSTILQEMEVVRLAGGRFAMISHGQTGTRVSELAANGTPTGVVTTVSTIGYSSASLADSPRIIAEGSGFLTLHIANGNLVMTRFNAAFAQVGGATTVLPGYPGMGSTVGYLKSDTTDPVFDFALLDSGLVVVAWRGYEGAAGGHANIFIRFFSVSGDALTDPIVANARVPDDQMAVSLSRMPDGRVFLSFMDDTNLLGGAQQYAQGVFIDGPDSYFVGGNGSESASGGAGDDALLGNAGNDTLSGAGGDDQVSGAAGHDSLSGDAGNDQLNGGDGRDTLSGGAGNDVFYGGLLTDLLNGGLGNDVLNGDEDRDTLMGDEGNDVLNGGAGRDLLDGGAGYDSLYGGDDDDTLLGQGSDDRLFGGFGNDSMNGQSGNDALDGGAGNDRMSGFGGDDALYGGDGHDQIYGDPGHDIVNGGSGNDTMVGGSGNDVMVGMGDDDYMVASDGNDSMVGGAGRDAMKGSTGDDTMHGGSGNDVMTGADGADTFQFNRLWSDGGTFGSDRVRDYDVGIDRIDLTGWGFALGSTVTVTGRGSTTVISTAVGDITLLGVTLAQFDTADILL